MGQSFKGVITHAAKEVSSARSHNLKINHRKQPSTRFYPVLREFEPRPETSAL